MLRRLLPFAVAALAAAPVAFADGGSVPPGLQGGAGAPGPGGGVRYVAVDSGSNTVVQEIKDGSVVRWTTIPGKWGIPSVAYDGSIGGVSRDGWTLVLAPTQVGYPLRKRSSFELLSTATFRSMGRVSLKGDFSFDALSPDGSKLYLIQHVSKRDLNRYVVRAYDLDLNRLLPGRIADRTQRGWVMAGWPLTRATSADGRWVYTLYARPDGYPFVHALDTVRGVAHCVGIPWHGSQNGVWRLRMSLRDGGRTLSLHSPNGHEYLAIARGTWRISHPGSVHVAASRSGDFPWWTVGLGAALGAALLLGAVRLKGRYGLRARTATN
ncbi:MAG TPA: hypothetical protein VE596_17280 [Gaiellaceae bacterium]|jgi:hypothetical protein|nr:hypothetical protein [Gaiellaceae bacterium]